MATDSSKNNGHVAFSNDVEEGAPVATGPDLSQSEKAWDIDGDGKLDPTELALKDIDKTGKGTLSKDQMYHLMHQNLMVQKDLKKVKKFVIGLVVLTALLALANVGVSFAAAYLAKDTKTVEGKLVVSSSGETVQTDSTTAVFIVDSDLHDKVRRERRLQCSNVGGGNNVHCNFPNIAWGYCSAEMGSNIALKCKTGASVTIGKEYTNAAGATVVKTHQVCPATNAEYTKYGNMWGMTITKTGAPDVTVQPLQQTDGSLLLDTDSGVLAGFAIGGLGSLGDFCTDTSHGIDNDCGADMKCESGVCVRSIGHPCDDANPCGSDLVCDGGICQGALGHDCNDFDHDIENHCDTDLKCEKAESGDAYGLCVPSIGYDCSVTNVCGSNLVCDGGKCKGDAGHGCKNPNSGLFDDDVVDLCYQGGVNSYSCEAAFTQYGSQGYGVCQCTSDGTSDTCGGGDNVCTNSGGCMPLADAPKLCRSQSALHTDCINMGEGNNFCSVTSPTSYQCVRVDVEEGSASTAATAAGGTTASTTAPPIFCPSDAFQCPDGSWVSRDPANNCEFPCEGGPPKPVV